MRGSSNAVVYNLLYIYRLFSSYALLSSISRLLDFNWQHCRGKLTFRTGSRLHAPSPASVVFAFTASALFNRALSLCVALLFLLTAFFCYLPHLGLCTPSNCVFTVLSWTEVWWTWWSWHGALARTERQPRFRTMGLKG